MITAILVDDEPNNNSNLKSLLERHCPNVEVIAVADNAGTAKQQIVLMRPDVVFLDIEMPDKSGFELLQSLDQNDFEVVFVTAFDAYALKAIKFSALEYLLKPISVSEMKQTVAKLEKTTAQKKQNIRLENLLSHIDKKSDADNQRIALPTLKETFIVPIKSIVRCESSNNYTTFFLIDGSTHIISKPLYEYDELLSSNGFIRCHQSHLINKIHVKSILNEDSGYLILNYSDKKIPVSKQRKAQVKLLLNL